MRYLWIAFLVVGGAASAHDFYSTACCDDTDCAPYKGAVREEPKGYRIVETGELIPYVAAKVSPDGQFHRCVMAQNKTRCLYAPPRGY